MEHDAFLTIRTRLTAATLAAALLSRRYAASPEDRRVLGFLTDALAALREEIVALEAHARGTEHGCRPPHRE